MTLSHDFSTCQHIKHFAAWSFLLQPASMHIQCFWCTQPSCFLSSNSSISSDGFRPSLARFKHVEKTQHELKPVLKSKERSHVVIWAPHASMYLHSTAEPASINGKRLCRLWGRKKEQKYQRVWSRVKGRDDRSTETTKATEIEG